LAQWNSELAKGRHDETFFRYGISDTGKYCDWYFISVYQSALHLVRAYALRIESPLINSRVNFLDEAMFLAEGIPNLNGITRELNKLRQFHDTGLYSINLGFAFKGKADTAYSRVKAHINTLLAS
jgi:hypothetical protein